MIDKHEILNTSRILIVDDEAMNVTLLKTVLRTEGYQNITTKTDSREVLPHLTEQDYDIVLLDINMPYLTGYDVIKQIKANNISISILVLTAQSNRETRIQALGLGANDFLVKPFDRVETLHRIFNLLSIQLLQKQLAVQNQRLEEKVKQRTVDLEQSRLDVIQRLGRAAEYRDNETGNHILRMSHYSKYLAEATGLDEQHVDNIFRASPMHDIGKIGIPDNILLKPGKLSPAEFTIMKTHAQIGADILSGSKSDILQLASIIAACHHEKWDGSGYPNQLSGKKIPIEARIVTICDVFDALTSIRPYKKAWSNDEAIQYLHDNKAVQFDPELVDQFCKILPIIYNVQSQYLDNAESDIIEVRR